MPQAEQIVHCQNMLGEGPLWHPQEKKLYWLDILGKKVQCYDPRDGAQESFSLDEIVSVIALCEKGSFVAAGENGFSFWDGSSPRVEHIHDPEAGKQGARFNDGKVDRAGRFWAGTMTRKGASSALYRPGCGPASRDHAAEPDHLERHRLEPGQQDHVPCGYPAAGDLRTRF